MRNNIIAIVIFVGFIATVFGIGYAVSRDTMPMHKGHVPNISTAGGMSVSREGVDDALALQQVSTEPLSRTSSGGYGGNSEWRVANGERGAAGGLRSSSSQRRMSYGGGGTSSGTIGSSSGGGKKVGNNSVGGSYGGGISSIAYSRRDDKNSGVLSKAPSELAVLDIREYNNPRLDGFNDSNDGEPGEGDRPGPYENPVGDIPWLMIVLAAAAFIKSATRHHTLSDRKEAQ